MLDNLEKQLGFLPFALRQEILKEAPTQTIPAGAEILREGQYVKMIPVVLSGLLKVFSRFEDRELLLYYIQPEESCIMSFGAMQAGEPSRVFATAEEETVALLLPVRSMPSWLQTYPSINQLFYRQYNQRYDDLLTTIHHLLFNKLDQRLLEYLEEKAELKGVRQLHLSHRQIANELGTAREVISRLMGKLEKEGSVKQLGQGVIEVNKLNFDI